MMRYCLAVICYLLVVTSSYGQVVFTGPTTGKPNKMNTVTVTEVNGNDFKIQVFMGGKLANPSDYLVLKNEDNQRVIMILTEEEQVFTLIAATNHDNKTFLSNHIITIGKPAPGPDPKPPVPDPVSDYSTKLKAAYKTSPDATSLPKLISILEAANAGTYRNFDEMEQVLIATAKKFLPGNELRKVRDTISDRIVEKAGTDPRRRNIQTVKDVYTETLTVLKGL